jgi:FKBP-type peptidyl-prolyl cis-trans isomerase SlpA
MNKERKLTIGDQVSLHYRLSCNGEEIINTFAAEPETFRLGQGEIDPRLEVLLIGLQANDHRTYDLDPGAAFGSHEANMIHDLPRSDFAADIVLIPGHEVEFTLPNGQTLHGIVRSIAADSVEVDFNHPLAGLPVVFEVKILAIETNTD